MRRFVAVDLETSGLDPHRHEIIEVGLVVEKERVRDSIIAEELTFSLPFNLDNADPKALEINGWGRRQFAPTRSHEYAVEILSDILLDVHIVGKNPWFDAGFLEAFFAPFGIEPMWHHRLVDVGSLAWGWYNARNPETPWPQPPNFEKVSEMVLGTVRTSTHGALDDARWAYSMFRRIVYV